MSFLPEDVRANGSDKRGTGCAPLTLGFLKTAEQEAAEAFWIGKASTPGLVCIKRDGGAWVGQIGDEPESYGDWLKKGQTGQLGSGGRGRVLVDAFGERTVSHNVWVIGYVPAEYVDLFEGTHRNLLEMSLKESGAYWTARGEGEVA